jgi:hypothetical protein
MRKFIGLSVTILVVLNMAAAAQERFGQYRRIEAYEVRPGILMMPRYTATNEICEIGLERLQYSPTLIRVSTDLSREEIFQTLDELVPTVERGKPSEGPANLITEGGFTRTTSIEYENVSIQIYGATLPSKHKNEVIANEVVATVKWKNRICR